MVGLRLEDLRDIADSPEILQVGKGVRNAIEQHEVAGIINRMGNLILHMSSRVRGQNEITVVGDNRNSECFSLQP